MKKHARETTEPVTLRQLLTDEDLGEVEENLDRHVALTFRIYERICGEPEAYADFCRLTYAVDDAEMDTNKNRHARDLHMRMEINAQPSDLTWEDLFSLIENRV